jgi:protein-L-isoaspartate(D-aspartate) O-methyltransferase
MQRASLDEIRSFYARLMTANAKHHDPRLERIFELVPRELFMPPGPWQVMVNGRYLETPSADPVYLYANSLVALDAEKGINNGEPFLHAALIGAVAPQPGECVVHVGAGTGYYSAILSLLVLPGGHVEAFELEEHLAEAAKANLAAFENVAVHIGNAVLRPIPPADVIYVNAAVAAPPVSWLNALKPGGRLIFPWQDTSKSGPIVLVSREPDGFAVKPLRPATFIPCVGASDPDCVATKAPEMGSAGASQSLHITADRPPDDTATAIYPEVWFSREAVKG